MSNTVTCVSLWIICAASSAPGLAHSQAAEVDVTKPASSGSDDDSPEAEEPAQDPTPEEPADDSVRVRYKDGLRIESSDGNFSARVRWRAQSRYTTVSSDNLPADADLIEDESGFRIRRARFKLDGHVYRPWLGYYLEYGIAGNVLLTLRFDFEASEKLVVRLGQYKVLYNRERVDSSGAQQFAERSIVTRPFTLDRQTGMNVMGRLFAGTWVDSRYAAGIYSGTGLGGRLDGDHEPMYIGRWQWNFLKRDLPYSQSDIARREDPAASLAFAAATSVGTFTRFSSSGGGQLEGFEAGEPGQYALDQWLAELAYHGRGLSLQAEYHSKRIEDRVNSEITELDGWYAQAGYFFHEVFGGFPEPLELAVRAARVDPRQGVRLPIENELTFGGNWFFHGHDNKITMDTSYLESNWPNTPKDTGWRLRVQWDVSF